MGRCPGPEALNLANRNITMHSNTDEEDKFTWNPESTNIRNKSHQETEINNFPPNLTKHQVKNWNTENQNLYKKIKEPLSSAPKLNMEVNNQWNKHKAHSCKKGKEELAKAYEEFNLSQLNTVINKMKRKAPGNDGLVIDHFKDLGMGGKLKLLEISNEIFSTGNFPDKFKQAIVVPILKKEKPARNPSSYRPISLLPVAGKIVESLVLKYKLNPYLEKRGLIPVVQTGSNRIQKKQKHINQHQENVHPCLHPANPKQTLHTHNHDQL